MFVEKFLSGFGYLFTNSKARMKPSLETISILNIFDKLERPNRVIKNSVLYEKSTFCLSKMYMRNGRVFVFVLDPNFPFILKMLVEKFLSGL